MDSPATATAHLPLKLVRYCPETQDYEVLIDGQVLGYAPTPLAGIALANEYVYQCLFRAQSPADAASLPPDAAEAVLAAQRMVGPAPGAGDLIGAALATSVQVLAREWQAAVQMGNQALHEELAAHEQLVRRALVLWHGSGQRLAA